MIYKIWDKTSSVKCPLKTFTKDEFMAAFPFAKDQDVLLGMNGEVAMEVSNLCIVLGNHRVDCLSTDTTDVKLQKLNAKLEQERLDETARIAAEEQAKQDALNDQYLRDCNAELATLTAMPDVTPVSEPVVEDTRYLNYKWNYDNGYWNKTILKLAVHKGAISLEEYQAITNEAYVA